MMVLSSGKDSRDLHVHRVLRREEKRTRVKEKTSGSN